jgi:hypothetical protein
VGGTGSAGVACTARGKKGGGGRSKPSKNQNGEHQHPSPSVRETGVEFAAVDGVGTVHSASK